HPSHAVISIGSYDSSNVKGQTVPSCPAGSHSTNTDVRKSSCGSLAASRAETLPLVRKISWTGKIKRMLESKTSYSWLGKYYDRFFSSFAPFAERARAVVLGPILPGVKSACDIACGTGTTALQLADRGIRMFGVDLSREMCRQARAKARDASLELRVFQ